MKPIRRIAILAVLLGSGAVASRAEEFAIKLSRPRAAGKIELVTASVKSDLVMTIVAQGREIKQEKHGNCRLTVAVENQQVTAKGNLLRAAVTVRSFTCEENGVSSQLKEGDVVTARRDNDKSVYELRGQELPDLMKEALGDAAPLHSDDEATDDEVFGTAKRRKIGDSWPVKGELVAKQMLEKGLKTTPKDITGTVRVVGKRQVGNTPCLEMQLNLELHDVMLAIPDLPPELTARVPLLRVTGTDLLPLDLSLEVPDGSLHFEGTLTMTGKIEDVAVTASGEMGRTVHVESSPIR
jgi:hypothetical protein